MQDKEIATTFGCLDSAVAADGTAMHAHALRTLGRAANRLYARGGPVMSLAFDSYTGGTPETRYGTAVQVGGFPAWHRVYWPVPVAKSPPHVSYEARVRHSLAVGEEIWLQVCTEAQPFDPHRPLDASNVLKLENDADNMQAITGIPAPRTATDLIELWAYSARHENLASEVTYGANNTGTVSGGTAWQFYDTTSTWTRAAVSAGRLVVAFYNASGIQVIGPRLVTGGGGDNLFVWPRLATSDWQAINGATYELHEMFQWELYSVALYEEDLT